MAKDPYRYFRVEAREILEGLGRGVLQLEKGATPDVTASLLRFAHTLKGAARVVKQPIIAEQAHALEDALAPLRDATATVAPDSIDHVLKLLDSISAQVTALGLPVPANAPTPQPIPVEEMVQTMRVDITEMDGLLDGISEASVQLRGMRRATVGVERARHLADLLLDQIAPQAALAVDGGRAGGGAFSPRMRSLAEDLRALVAGLERSLGSGIDEAERQMQQVRDAAERLRLLPAGALFSSLERTARDVGHALGKQVAFAAKGGDVRIDAHVLAAVQSALVQMIRNAVAHGIEVDIERARAGKPAAGCVEIEVRRRGSRVVFACRDDGRGIDVEAVRRAAQSRGLIPSNGPSLDTKRLLGLLLEGGLTTSGTVTETSGRGIGLDVVREVTSRLGGEVTIDTMPGGGTTVELAVPVSMSSLDALLVEAGGVSAAIPLDAVARTIRIVRSQVTRTDDGSSIVHDGQVIPFVPLSVPLRADATRRDADAWSTVIVHGRTALAAFGVDRLLGAANIVVRPLPVLAPAGSLIAGAAMDGEGTPQLVLDPVGLVAAALQVRGTGDVSETTPAACVLVIDDSLTTRMLEQSILESSGFEVDLATSAEEGLEKARRRRYQLFLVDVEMPGMDGFAFVETTRADPILRDVPAILVTSRDAAEDRRRGADAGASAYIVKGEFDQGHLLETIRRLVN